MGTNGVREVIPTTWTKEELLALLHEFVRYDGLNDDQIKLLEECSSWFDISSDPRPQIILGHGAFGSGKSFVLAILIRFLVHTLGVIGAEDRILVSAATNTAVDRILLELLNQGYSDFIRVGSLPKIAKPVLPHTLHRSEKTKKGGEDAETLSNLKAMLQDPSLTVNDRRVVEEEIKIVQSGRLQARKELLHSSRVVGVTCAAAAFPILDTETFSIVLLDEGSQMPESLSLLPLRFKASHLLCIGDPKQLPPTLAINDKAMERTLFVRLAQRISPIQLRTQYRVSHLLIASVIQ